MTATQECVTVTASFCNAHSHMLLTVRLCTHTRVPVTVALHRIFGAVFDCVTQWVTV